MLRSFVSLRISLACASAIASQDAGQGTVLDVGPQLSAVALNGAASTRTFTIGPRVENKSVLGFSELILEHFFDYTANAGAITTTCTVGRTAATATFSPTTCTTSAGTCTVNMGGIFVTSSLSADTRWIVRMKVEGFPVIKCVVSHGGTPGATDTITVNGYLWHD